MTLSVIIPVYNAEPYLEKCVQSCLAPDCEIILIDDGSTDGSLALARRIAAEHPGITLEQNPAPAFHNISFTIPGRRLVIVSKEKSPAIHFVIHHKMMVQAFLNFIPPIVDPGES